jgi:hypothetical protein
MLRALDDLERAVGQLVEKARGKTPDSSFSRSTVSPVGEAGKGQAVNRPDQVDEEAAELIRRAIKRLKSL